jgi:Ca2+/Na+ antiporter
VLTFLFGICYALLRLVTVPKKQNRNNKTARRHVVFSLFAVLLRLLRFCRGGYYAVVVVSLYFLFIQTYTPLENRNNRNKEYNRTTAREKSVTGVTVTKTRCYATAS